MRTGIIRTVQATLLAAFVLHFTAAAATITALTTVVTSKSGLSEGYAEITATCPVGMFALSGSIDSSSNAEIVKLAPVFNGVPLLSMSAGSVSGGPTGWYGGVMLSAPSVASPNVLKLAVTCARDSASVSTTIAAGTAIRMLSTSRVQATCPAASVAVGGGIDIVGSDDLSFFRIRGNRAATVGDVPAVQPQLVGWEGEVAGAPQIAFIVQPEPKVDARYFKVAAVCLSDGHEVIYAAQSLTSTEGTASANASCPSGYVAISGGVLAEAGYDRGWISASASNLSSDGGLQRLPGWPDGARETSSRGWYATLNRAGDAVSTRLTQVHALCVPTLAASGTRAMQEFYYAALDYYFVTSRDSDVSLLDRTPGWTRTGRSFQGYTATNAGLAPIRRFYFGGVAKNGSRGSHFYTLLVDEVAALQVLNPGNQSLPGKPFDEDVEAFAALPLGGGSAASCAAGLQPVYRLFRGNARFPDNPNHRFTTDLTLYNTFVALGWDGEGVKFCVPG